MNKLSKTVAFIYDFDETLIYDYTTDYGMFTYLGIEKGQFWTAKNEFGKNNNIDSLLMYMYHVTKVAQSKNLPLTKEIFASFAQDIKYFPGVKNWFDNINKFGKNLGLKIEHYVISSGLKEIIDGCAIADKFKNIFASSFYFDQQNNPVWPANSVNDANKTQYIYRIRKRLTSDLYDSKELNKKQSDKLKLPYENMFYFGDGITDIPCMKIIKQNGGNSICVYNPDNNLSKQTAQQIFNDGRVNFIVPADYTPDSQLDKIIKQQLQKIAKI